ncbi:MAG: hypothetical protein AAGA54_21440 [Myxococcota bacterium]
MPSIEVFGATGALHDAIAGVPGDFDLRVAALESSPDALVVTGVTRSNARHLDALVPWLHARGVRRWTQRWPGPVAAGSGPSRLGLVVPRMLHAAVLATRTGLQVRLLGIPPCLLGPHRHLAGPPEPVDAPWRCGICPGESSCSGVPGSYGRWYHRDLELRDATQS